LSLDALRTVKLMFCVKDVSMNKRMIPNVKHFLFMNIPPPEKNKRLLVI